MNDKEAAKAHSSLLRTHLWDFSKESKIHLIWNYYLYLAKFQTITIHEFAINLKWKQYDNKPQLTLETQSKRKDDTAIELLAAWSVPVRLFFNANFLWFDFTWHFLNINPLTDEEHFSVPQNRWSLQSWFTSTICFRAQNDHLASCSLVDRFAP